MRSFRFLIAALTMLAVEGWSAFFAGFLAFFGVAAAADMMASLDLRSVVDKNTNENDEKSTRALHSQIYADVGENTLAGRQFTFNYFIDY